MIKTGLIRLFFSVFTVGLFCNVVLGDEKAVGHWEIKGVIGESVKRVNDQYPLSDQNNVGNWERYSALSDEFEGCKVDERKWHKTNPTWKGRRPAFFNPNNVSVSDGKLHLKMRKEKPSEELKKMEYHTYSSAAVKSKTLVKYGYFEVMCRPMKSSGSSSFWFYEKTDDLWTEIDVFEISGGAEGFEKKFNSNIHVFRTPEEKKHRSYHCCYTADANLADDYHVYALEWGEKKICWYFDGVVVREADNTKWHQELTLNFDSETMPGWFGLPKDSDLPSTYSIEYIRVWKKTVGNKKKDFDT